jgi:hypothetical protein
MAGRSSRSSGIMSTRSPRSTSATASEQKLKALTSTSMLQSLKFYWNRPLGAPTGTHRLTVCLAGRVTSQPKHLHARAGASGARKKSVAPLSWSLAYTTVDDLCTAILESPTVVNVELVGSSEAYEALGGVTLTSWNQIRDALVTVLHRCRDDQSSRSSSSASSLVQSLQFASGVMDQQIANLLASALKKKRQPSTYKSVGREVESPKYSVKIEYDTDIAQQSLLSSSSSSSSSPSLLTDTLQQLWVGRDQLHALHLHFQGGDSDGGGGGGGPYAVTAQDTTLLAEILPHLHTVSFDRMAFTCPAAWKLVFASLEESSRLERLHLDVTVLNQHHQNRNDMKCKRRNESSVSTATATTTPDQTATLQAYLDWNVRLNTVRRRLVERECEVQSVQSKATRNRSLQAYRQQQQQQQQVSDNSSRHAAVAAAAAAAVEVLAATETAAMMDAAVVVLKDWWRATHRPDLPQYQYQHSYQHGILESEGDGVHPPHEHDHASTATDVTKNGATENQTSAGAGLASSLQQRDTSNVAMSLEDGCNVST